MSKSQKKLPAPKVTKGKKTARIAKTARQASDKKAIVAKNAARSNSKQNMLITLLQHSAGATVEEMAKTTGWQKHSVLGAISGVLKKKLGLTITSDKEERGRVYRVAGGGRQ